ncbi:16S rRNA (guanine(527)-N(7))-methyltransferase RsmG [Candidatus Puniceispirillum marinum]|uniref:Ribosomal RNA small subunit methyltransferase G n=1 Tax=Puniceispirillum marinum (strain IMCC1322) TaxID=488538 RepID=D5BUE3_PUNMI|nr:16S rRNA (guanine(527)-N(7))-methyltransferase RsmG [Candidatus Puniceispirillum marinum]ADE39890.1 Glucose inhibited division protein [Candidatus Puniceispirillum marinum IMCC1322]
MTAKKTPKMTSEMTSEMTPEMTPETVQDMLNVSRETIDKFAIYLALLEKWQKSVNLVARATLDIAWQRHILDSGQLARYLPAGCKTILDVGSGAGFPGLVLSIMQDATVHMVESDHKKTVFLQTVIRKLDLSAVVHNERIESLPAMVPDVITARAFAPLGKAITLLAPHMRPDTVLLLLKGRNVEEELTEMPDYPIMAAVTYPSLSDPEGMVLQLTQDH